MTAWHRRQFLPEALASIGAARGTDVEIVVVADFRDSALAERVERRGGTWIVSTEERIGAMTAEGIRASRGTFVALLEDDDLYHPSRLDLVCDVFRSNPELGWYHNLPLTFRDGGSPAFPSVLPESEVTVVPAGRRTRSDCQRIWTLGAGYNGTSTVVRRSLLEPHLEEFAGIRKGIAPYLFYRAWTSPMALFFDPRPLTAVRLHGANLTPNRLQGRRARFARLASIAADLASDADAIRAFLPQETWSVPLVQMSSMGDILTGATDRDKSRGALARASLELLRRRKTWLPRWTLVSLAVARIGSRRGGRALYRWLTAEG